MTNDTKAQWANLNDKEPLRGLVGGPLRGWAGYRINVEFNSVCVVETHIIVMQLNNSNYKEVSVTFTTKPSFVSTSPVGCFSVYLILVRLPKRLLKSSESGFFDTCFFLTKLLININSSKK